MHLDLSWYGNRKMCLQEATAFLDAQVFLYPEYQVAIAGIRGGIVGLCQGMSDDAQGFILGHLRCDGSMTDAALTVQFTGVK